MHRRSWGGGAGGALAPPWKNQLAWQDKNGSLAGQKWELGRTEMAAWQDRNESLAEDNLQKSTFSKVFCHFCLFSATFGLFLPYFPVFLQFLNVLQPFTCNICPLAEQFGRVAQHGRTESANLAPPDRKNFGRKGLNFGRTEWLAPL